jgi:hypothetical protein
MSQKEQYTIEDFHAKLSQRVSAYNARLTFQSALISAGLNRELTVFNKEETRALCLALINKGGPAFQVGKDLYTQIQ